MKYNKRIQPKAHKKRDYSYGKSNGRRSNNPRRLEELPTFAPMNRTYGGHGYGCVWLQVQRFFESRIGQQWYKVWSEFCERCNVEWVRREVWRYMVYQNVEIIGGVVCHLHTTYGFSVPLEFGRSRALFVHPRTGQLCGQKSHARKQAKRLGAHWRDHWF